MLTTAMRCISLAVLAMALGTAAVDQRRAASSHIMRAERTDLQTEVIAVSARGELFSVDDQKKQDPANATVGTNATDATGNGTDVGNKTEPIKFGKETMTALPCNNDFPIGTVDTADCPYDSLLVVDEEMCKFAASVTNAGIDEQRFKISKEWFPYHPHGCFAFPCSSEIDSSSKMCYYFNPGEDPCENPANETHKCTGVPICYTTHYLNGKVNGNNGCKNSEGTLKDEFEVIVDEEECKGASNCMGYCRNQQFRVLEETNICSYSQKQCETMAGSLGLTLGDTGVNGSGDGSGMAFVGEYSTTGCFTYGRGEKKGKAFYGTKNSIEPVSEVDLTEPDASAGEYRVIGTYECLTGLTELKGMGTDANYEAAITVKSKQACADLVPEGGGYYYKFVDPAHTCRPIVKGSVQALRAEFAAAPFTVTDADATYLPAAQVRKAFPGQGSQGNNSVYKDAGVAASKDECAAKAAEGGSFYYDATSCKVVSAADTEKLRAQLKTIDWSGPNCNAAGATSGNATNASLFDSGNATAATSGDATAEYPDCSTWLPTVPHANQSIHHKYPEGCFIEEDFAGGCVRYNPPSLNFGLPKFPVGTPVCSSQTPGHMWPALATGISVPKDYGIANTFANETAAPAANTSGAAPTVAPTDATTVAP